MTLLACSPNAQQHVAKGIAPNLKVEFSHRLRHSKTVVFSHQGALFYYILSKDPHLNETQEMPTTT